MELSRADIKKFQELYMKHFKLKLSDSLARVKLSMLVRQVELIYQPVTNEQISKLKDLDYDLPRKDSTKK